MENIHSKNQFTNYKKLIDLAGRDWHSAQSGRICELNVKVKSNNQLIDQYGRKLHHFCTTSYLGLDYNPKILKGAIQGIKESQNTSHCKLKKSMQT